MGEVIQVQTTVQTREEAENIARVLVEKRLAACAQISGPISSMFWWNGKIETAEEWRCIVKTEGTRFRHVEKEIRAIHPYEIPEIIATPIAKGNADYLVWIEREVM